MKRLLGIVVGLILLATACGGATAEDTVAEAATGNDAADSSVAVAEPESAGEPIPDFTATTVSGSQISANDLKGSDVVLWFWAPW